MMHPDVIRGHIGNLPNNLTGFSQFRVKSTGEILWYPSDYINNPVINWDLEYWPLRTDTALYPSPDLYPAPTLYPGA